MALNDMTQEEVDALNAKNRDAARNNQMSLGVQAAKSTMDQAKAGINNLEQANRDNLDLANTMTEQNRHLTAANSFNALRDLQNAATGVRNSMGQGLNGSGTYNYLDLLASRQDKNAMTYWNELQNNNNKVANDYQQALNQNAQKARDIDADAQKAYSDIRANTIANINNIRSQDVENYKDWDINAAYNAFDTETQAAGANTGPISYAKDRVTNTGGYGAPTGYTPYNQSEAAMNINRRNDTRYISGGNDYYSQLLNSYNRGYQNKR